MSDDIISYTHIYENKIKTVNAHVANHFALSLDNIGGAGPSMKYVIHMQCLYSSPRHLSSSSY